MTPHEWAATFGSICILAAIALAVWALCTRALETEDDNYRRQTQEPVDRALWEPTAPLWQNSATPIYDRLSAERLRADLDDDDAVQRWMEMDR